MYKRFFRIYMQIVAMGVFITLVLLFSQDAKAAVFNTDIQDHPTLLLANYTKNQGCTTCWSTYVSADPGDIISFLVYYHNTSTETAPSTRLRVILPTPGFTSATITGQVIAQDGTGASGNATLIVLSRQVLSFIPNSARWYPEQTASPQPPELLLMGQTGSEVMTPEGVYVGDLKSGWGDQGHFIFRAQLQNDADESAPTVVTKTINAGGRYTASASASINPNNSDAKAWIEWGSASLEKTTAHAAIGSGSYTFSFSTMLSSIRPNTAYYYRAVAENARGKTYGQILSFNTDANGNALVSYKTASVSTETPERTSYSVAVLHGTVKPQGNDSKAWFEWGTTPALGIQTPFEDIQADEVSRNLSNTLTDLSAERTYYYRAVAENARGKTFGTITKFTSLPITLPSIQKSTGTSSASKTLNPADSSPKKVAPIPGQKPDLSFAAIGTIINYRFATILFVILLILVGIYFAYRGLFKNAKPL